MEIHSFKEHGIEIDATTGGSPTGLADGWLIEKVRVSDCDGKGFYVHGNDAQTGTAIYLD